jgi:hypothetical protein
VAERPDDLAELRSILGGSVKAVGQTLALNGLDPAPGSQAAGELARQDEFAGLRTTPVENALSIAALRLATATGLIEALERLLTPPASIYGSAVAARGVLEVAARASWALDPRLDVRGRITRGLTDSILNLVDVLKYPIEPVKYEARPKLDRLLRYADEQGFELRWSQGKTRRFLGVEESAPRYADTVEREFGTAATIVYRDLSQVAHGTLTALIDRTEEVADLAGTSLRGPGDATRYTMSYVTTLLCFVRAHTRRIRLYGWNRGPWNAWLAEARPAIAALADQRDTR